MVNILDRSAEPTYRGYHYPGRLVANIDGERAGSRTKFRILGPDENSPIYRVTSKSLGDTMANIRGPSLGIQTTARYGRLPHSGVGIRVQVPRGPGHQSLQELHRHGGNAAVATLLLQRQQAPDPPSATGYLGLNPTAGLEVEALKKVIGGTDKLLISRNDAALENSLATKVGIEAWVDALGIADALKPAAILLLDSADPRVRDQLSDLMSFFIGAEKGNYRLDRLVLSGHSDGVLLFGSETETQSGAPLYYDKDFKGIAKLFPAAASQVEDIMFSGCYSSGAIGICVDTFPNLQTCWAYEGACPLAESGATAHIQHWAKATVGTGRLAAEDKMGNTALWSGGKFVVGDPSGADFAKLKAQIGSLLPEATKMLQGERDLDDSLLTPLYELVMRVSKDTLSLDYPGYLKMHDWLLRLRHWDDVTSGFAKKYAKEITHMHESVGLADPSIQTMTRKQAVDYVNEWSMRIYTCKLEESIVEFFNEKVLEGLYYLDPTVIDITWIN